MRVNLFIPNPVFSPLTRSEAAVPPRDDVPQLLSRLQRLHVCSISDGDENSDGGPTNISDSPLVNRLFDDPQNASQGDLDQLKMEMQRLIETGEDSTFHVLLLSSIIMLHPNPTIIRYAERINDETITTMHDMLEAAYDDETAVDKPITDSKKNSN